MTEDYTAAGAKTDRSHRGKYLNNNKISWKHKASSGVQSLGLLFLLAQAVTAETLYVRPNGATYGTGNGTSWQNAWSGFSAVVWGSGAGQLGAGDTLYVAAGDYSQSFTAGGSGTAASPVLIRAAQDTYVGTATFSGTISFGSKSYVTLDGEYNGNRNFAATGSLINLQNTTGAAFRYFTLQDGQIDMRFAKTSNVGYVHVYMSASAEWALNGEGSGNSAAYDQSLIENCYVRVPGQLNNGTGGDGIKPGRGFTIQQCVIQSVVGTVSNLEHQDLIQIYGNSYIKVIGTEFIDSGDAQLGVDSGGSTVNNLRFYNNVFRRTIGNMGTVMLRIYSSGSTISSFSDVRIDNNTFVDGSRTGPTYGAAVRIHAGNGATSASGCSIQNNLFYNCGNGWPCILMQDISANWTYDYNLINAGAAGNTSASGWSQAHGQTAAPSFVSYTAYSLGSDLHLASADVAAQNKATSLTSFFSTDCNGVLRPQGAAWDIGAYEVGSASGNTNAQIQVSPASLDFGSVAVGSTTNLNLTVRNSGGNTLSGAASVGLPFSVVSGGAYSLASNQSQTVVLRYAPTASGSHSQSVSFSGGGNASVPISGSAWSALSGLTFSAAAGSISAPFNPDGSGYVSQALETSLASGGRAVYAFTITSAGYYQISINVNAPDTSSDSLFVNIDAEPTDPQHIWDVIPLTSGYEVRKVGGRGVGDNTSPEFPGRQFNLAVGAHQLIIRGREANCSFGAITLSKVVPPPPNFHVME